MKIEEFIACTSPKSYTHFDAILKKRNAISYITKRSNIVSHSFYPFIHYTLSFAQYNKGKKKKNKERDIYYCAHIDGWIYKYYSWLLNEYYNKKVKADGLDSVAIAYRNDLHKSNINFAKEAFEFIRKQQECFILIGDFTSFFDTLDHSYLKSQIRNLLKVKTLPEDYYAVFKNITKYSFFELDDIYRINGLKKTRKNRKYLNNQNTILTLEQFKSNKKDCLKTNPNDFGIPQGSPISSTLSNIYMLNFDKEVNNYVCKNNGLYMRYSDDFIIIIPKSKNSFKNIYDNLIDIVKHVPNLDLQKDKTETYVYSNKDINIYDYNENEIGKKSMINYLGFSFDGTHTRIRDKTISKYYYRMYRKIKGINKNNRISKNGKVISLSKLYIKYSIRGAHRKKSENSKNKKRGNFITYVDRTKKIFEQNVTTTSTDNHMQKIRKRLKQG